MDTEKIKIGLDVKIPKEKCDDRGCPFHGDTKVRKKVHKGIVIKSKMQKTATVEWEWKRYVPKYERYEKCRTRVKAHNPPCIKAEAGDTVIIAETRPMSKTKNFVIVEKS